MDIRPAYSCLLGRPWIHGAGAVTSTLHQKLKYPVKGKIVTACRGGVHGQPSEIILIRGYYRGRNIETKPLN